MKRLLIMGLALLGLGFAAAPASACFCGHHACCLPPCAAECAPACTPCVSYVDKVVTCYKPVWKERVVTCTINHFCNRQIQVTKMVYTPVPITVQEERFCCTITCVPHEVEKEVTCCRMVPVCVTDPCTGCTHTSCKPETYVQKVKCTVMENVAVVKKITVPVCNYKMEGHPVTCCQTVTENKPEIVSHKECYCEMVAYQTTVKVPVCTPAAPCCK